MPTRHGIEVSVTTPDGKVLTEYGTQNLGRFAWKSKFVSTRIQATAGQTFYIKVKPEVPFPHDEDDDSGDKQLASIFARAGPSSAPGDRYDLRPRAAPRFDDKQPIEDPTVTKSDNTKSQQASPNTIQYRPPPFDLSVFVYIDGHEKPECRQIIWLDPSDHRYQPNGISLKGRWVRGEGHTGHVGIRNWVFTSIGIDVLMDRMKVQNDDNERQATEEARDFEALAEAMAHNQMDSELRPRPGQIEVRVTRIYTSGPSQIQSFRPYHYGGSGETADAAEIGADVTHTVTLQDSSQRNMRLNTVAWRPYKRNEEIYAKFMFMYMGREKLYKMGLCNHDGTPRLQGRIHAAEPEKRVAKQRKRAELEDSDEDNNEVNKRSMKSKQGDDLDSSDEDVNQLSNVSRTRNNINLAPAAERIASPRRAKMQANVKLLRSFGTASQLSESRKVADPEEQEEQL